MCALRKQHPTPQLVPPWQRVVDACPRHPSVSMSRVATFSEEHWRCPLCATGSLRPLPRHSISPIRIHDARRRATEPAWRIRSYDEYMYERWDRYHALARVDVIADPAREVLFADVTQMADEPVGDDTPTVETPRAKSERGFKRAITGLLGEMP